jgi:hypothetical protein
MFLPQCDRPSSTPIQKVQVQVKAKVKVKIKLSLCLTKHHAMKKYWRSGGVVPLILDLGTRMKVSGQIHDPAALPQGKRPRYPGGRRMGGTQSRSGHGGEGKNSQPPQGIEL